MKGRRRVGGVWGVAPSLHDYIVGLRGGGVVSSTSGIRDVAPEPIEYLEYDR